MKQVDDNKDRGGVVSTLGQKAKEHKGKVAVGLVLFVVAFVVLSSL